LARSVRLSKLSIRSIHDQTNYATSEALIESIHALRVTHNVPIERYLRDLTEGKVDSISITKDDPYHYFYARVLAGSVAVTYKEAQRIIEFALPLADVEKVLLA